MKPIFTTISAICLAGGCLVGGLGIGAASALPRADTAVGAATTATAPIDKARLVCNYHRCWHVGYYHRYWYRPYGYYRPYYYAPHVGIGLGGFGVRLF